MDKKTPGNRRKSITLPLDTTVGDALSILKKEGLSHAPVVDKGRILGRVALQPEQIGDRLSEMGMQPSAVEAELRMAKQIQQQFLPKTIPQIPGLEVYGALASARAVGGDYWSVKYYRADGRATLKLADVTGHGIAAALLVPAVKFVSGGFYRGAPTPEWVMERTNHVLVKETPVELMVTMMYAWYFVAASALAVVNAGHSPVFVIHQGEIVDIPPGGPMLGLMETGFTSSRVEMAPGDLFFCCSDGITEAGEGHNRFGEDRVKGLVWENRDRRPQEIAQAVLAGCCDFGSDPQDDRSVLVACRKAR